jgi:FAD binding domain/Berberine and berberine like
MNPTTLAHAPAAVDIHALRAHLGIEIVTPADAEWDEARLAWNLAIDQRPAAVAFPESTDDVAAIVDFAREHGLRVAPQSTGHNAGPLELDYTILLKTERMRDVRIDPATRTARVGGGAQWQDVTGAAGEHGLAALAGSSPDVGVVGYTLGGGLSWMARRYGLAANHVTAVEVVTADGRIVRADAANDPDLFWALRGGGGSFGIVTALEFELFPIAQVYAGMLAFPIERASEVLHGWREWTATLPDEVTSIARLMRIPPLPEIPEPVRGRQLVIVEANVIGAEADGIELLEPLRALGPEIDTFAMIPAPALSRLHMDPEHPVPGITTTSLLRELPPEAISALVGVAGPGVESPLLSVELRHLGAAAGRAPDSGGAVSKIDAPFAMFAVGMAITPQMAAAVEASIPPLDEALAPYRADRSYTNFAEERSRAEELFGDAYARLREVKAKYDPSDLIRANHPVAPAH